MNYIVEYDEITNKIITDEKTNENCRKYYFVKENEKGVGVIASNRTICIKKLLKELKSDVNELKKNIKKKEKILRELEVFVK